MAIASNYIVLNQCSSSSIIFGNWDTLGTYMLGNELKIIINKQNKTIWGTPRTDVWYKVFGVFFSNLKKKSSLNTCRSWLPYSESMNYVQKLCQL